MSDQSESNQIGPGVWVAAGGLRMQFARSAGPGGQNVNKVNTRAELWVRVESIIGLTQRARARLRTLAGSRLTLLDEIHLRSDAERSQEANRQDVLQRLRELVVQARHEPKVRKKSKPSRASKQRRLESKRHRGEIKSQRRGRAEDW